MKHAPQGAPQKETTGRQSLFSICLLIRPSTLSVLFRSVISETPYRIHHYHNSMSD